MAGERPDRKGQIQHACCGRWLYMAGVNKVQSKVLLEAWNTQCRQKFEHEEGEGGQMGLIAAGQPVVMGEGA